MRADRGFCCANELAIGMRIPDEELALFRHKLSGSAFFDTGAIGPALVRTGGRRCGLCGRSPPLEDLLAEAQARAEGASAPGANQELSAIRRNESSGESPSINRADRAAISFAAARRGSPCAWESLVLATMLGATALPRARPAPRRLCAEGPADLYRERCLLDRRARCREGRSHRLRWVSG